MSRLDFTCDHLEKGREQMSEYNVGYRKPPIATQFRHGISGNPNGRPKPQRKTFGTAILDVVNEEIEVVENGQTKTVSIIEAIVTQFAAKAARGDVRAVKMLLDLYQHVEEFGEITPLIIQLSETDMLL
jgi:hypothetical protein